jgi:hypothetical protein
MNQVFFSSLARIHFGARRKAGCCFLDRVRHRRPRGPRRRPPVALCQMFRMAIADPPPTTNGRCKEGRSEFIIQDAALRAPPYFDDERIGRSFGPRLIWRSTRLVRSRCRPIAVDAFIVGNVTLLHRSSTVWFSRKETRYTLWTFVDKVPWFRYQSAPQIERFDVITIQERTVTKIHDAKGTVLGQRLDRASERTGGAPEPTVPQP